MPRFGKKKNYTGQEAADMIAASDSESDVLNTDTDADEDNLRGNILPCPILSFPPVCHW
jgi:hypothetical protein